MPAMSPLHDGVADTWRPFDAMVARDMECCFRKLIASRACPDQSTGVHKIRLVIARLLEAIAGLMNWLGFSIQTFASATEFLASPHVASSSCVITDVQMPHMTGIELHKHLTELGHAIPTILITAYPNDAARDRVLADGVVCYLSKPFDNDALIECVRSALQPQVG
jgi:CheY-like chemotaxis protein